jgi:hypothetical protein
MELCYNVTTTLNCMPPLSRVISGMAVAAYRHWPVVQQQPGVVSELATASLVLLLGLEFLV